MQTRSRVADMTIAGTSGGRRVTELHLRYRQVIAMAPEDRVPLTLRSMTDATATGSGDAAPPAADEPSPGFDLWRRLTARHDGLGRLEVFAGRPERTSWTAFTATLASPAFAAFMERFSGNRTGTGGLVTFAEPGWLMSVVMVHQPHFRAQPAGRTVFWGYGLHGDRPGDAVRKPMATTTRGRAPDGTRPPAPPRSGTAQGGLRRGAGDPRRMPLITSQFMPRRGGDRAPVIPRGAGNFAVIGQFCEMPRDCVFTVEYSVRSAWTAVHGLTGRVPPPPSVLRSDRDPRVLLRAARVLLSG